MCIAAGNTLATESECLQCPAKDDTVVFYVDAAAQPAQGSIPVPWMYHMNRIDRPVETIADARNLVRNIKATCSPLEYHIRVDIRAGTYPPATTNSTNPLPEPLEFTAMDSGAEDYPVIYRAYSPSAGNYESVLISGGIELTDWTTQSPAGGDRWWTQTLPSGWATTDFKDPLMPRDLYIDNARATRAREPDEGDLPLTSGFARIDGPIYDLPELGDTVTEADKAMNEYALSAAHLFPEPDSGPRAYTPYRGTECVMRNAGSWISHRQYVREIDPDPASGTTYIRLHDMLGVPEQIGVFVYEDDTSVCRYATEIYLENAKEFMDEPYEWWFNPQQSGDPAAPGYPDDRLWVILPGAQVPPGPHSEVANTTIVIPYAPQLFVLDGASHVQFVQLNFAHTHQELPRPQPFSDLLGGQKVVEVDCGGMSGCDFSLVNRSQVDLAKVDYPLLGWFERMRSFEFYRTKPPAAACADQTLADPDLRYRLDGAIRIVNGSNIEIRRCRVAHTGGSAVVMENGADHQVRQNEMFDVGASAIVACRLNLQSNNCHLVSQSLAEVPRRFDIADNFVYHVGQTFLSSPAVFSGWTAAETDPPTFACPDDCSYIHYNYFNETPAEAISSGFTPGDNPALNRPQSRGIRINHNIVRNATLLLDDMAGIVLMRDGDLSRVGANVVFQDPAVSVDGKRGIYTDGKSQFADQTYIPTFTGWQIADNLLWGYHTPFAMNTSYTCPEFNDWDGNYTEQVTPGIKCRKCDFSEASQPECSNDGEDGSPCAAHEIQFCRDSDCGNGFLRPDWPHLKFDEFAMPTRYIYNQHLAVPGTGSGHRGLVAQDLVDDAGPRSTHHAFLYTDFESLIHPTNPPATNRTPPAP
ncbi:MAG: right-handed parallel beta-helix repeat-containing protein [Planctomycetota bacterium]